MNKLFLFLVDSIPIVGGVIISTALWLFLIWLLWLIYSVLAPVYFAFAPAAWLSVPYWHFAGLMLLLRAVFGPLTTRRM